MNAQTLWRSLEITAWTFGLLLVLLYIGARVSGEVERQDAVAQFSARATSAMSARQVAVQAIDAVQPTAPARSEMQRWSAHRIQQFESVQQANTPADGDPVALLRIPRVQLEVPVYSELNERNLNRGAALVSGTAAPDSNGNVAIAAHRDGYFRALQAVAVGDLVNVQLQARERAYRITAISIVEPTDLWPLEATSSAALTLVTCYPFYFVGSAPQRYVVRAEALH